MATFREEMLLRSSSSDDQVSSAQRDNRLTELTRNTRPYPAAKETDRQSTQSVLITDKTGQKNHSKVCTDL